MSSYTGCITVISRYKKSQIENPPKIVGSGAYFEYQRALKLHIREQLVANVRVTLEVISSNAVTLPCFER